MADFGCGYGHFAVEAAKRIDGVVHALDLDPAMTAATAQRAAEAGLKNIHIVLRDFLAEGSGLPDASVVYATLFNILHVEEPVALLREAHRILKPGGQVGIIHWNYDPRTPRGPSMSIRPQPEQCRAWGEEAGLQFDKYLDLACCPHHYGVVLRKVPGAC